MAVGFAGAEHGGGKMRVVGAVREMLGLEAKGGTGRIRMAGFAGDAGASLSAQ